jgi:hypothetical protein
MSLGRDLPEALRETDMSYEHWALFITYVNSLEFKKRIEDAIEEGRRDLAELESNPYRNCMPGCYVG